MKLDETTGYIFSPETVEPEPEPETEPEPEEEIATVDIRIAASGVIEILLTVPADSLMETLGRDGDWLQVKLGETVGYIFSPVPADPEATPEMKVTVFISRGAVVVPGEMIRLTSYIEGFDGYEIMYQWECDQGNGFEAVEGANEDSYVFAASKETLAYDWRLAVYYR